VVYCGFFLITYFGFVLVDATGCAEWTVAASAAATSTLSRLRLGVFLCYFSL
jgi:hypothetical protein